MWIKTSKEICVSIMNTHKEELGVHSSFTDVDGDGYEYSTGKPEILTDWGFKKSEYPLCRVLLTKDNKEQREWVYEYFLYCA